MKFDKKLMETYCVYACKMQATRCFISKCINIDGEWDKSDQVFGNIEEVPVKKNEILKGIMDSYYMWDSDPTVFIRNIPYKLKMINRTEKRVEMFQKYIRILTKKNGNTWYKVVNVRKVIIHF